MDIKKYIPWWLKILIKLILSNLPIKYNVWKRVGLFKHGSMDKTDKANATFQRYFNIIKKYTIIPKNFKCLEIGPGDSILTGLAAKKIGCKKYWAIDNGFYANTNLNLLKNALMRNNFESDICKFSSSETLLKFLNINYLTNGIKSFKDIPNSSLDFCWSQVVLEHVYLDEINFMIKEIYRTLKPDTYSIHAIDFRDHLGGGLNNLRFSSKVWESKLFRNSGFYTNRIPAKVMHSIFRKVGFTIVSESFGKWPKLPTSRKNMDKEFNIYSDCELMNRTSNVLLQK